MKNIKLLLQKLITMMMRNTILVHAEEPPVTPPATPTTPTPAPTINFETLIASARKEEKDKLYPQINTLKLDKEALTTRVNELLLSLGDKDSKITELTKALKQAESGHTDPEEVKTLKGQVTDLTVQNTTLTAQVNSMKLEGFKNSKIAEAQGEIISELVVGATEEDITASIEVAKAKYQELANKFKGNGTAPASNNQVPPPANPSALNTNLNMQNITPGQIASMTREEYSQYRKKLFGK